MVFELTTAKASDLEDIIKIWGPNRMTLGLMPRDGFKDAIRKRWLIIAKQDGFIVGYLMFRYTNKNQTVSIVHLCVDKNARGHGLSTQLVDRLVADYKDKARGIKLSCRSDYTHAINFWTRYNFQPKGKHAGRGNNPNVHLIVWWFSFGKNDLFSFIPSDKLNVILDFNIIAKLRDLSINDGCYQEVAHLLTDYLQTETEYYKTSETVSEIFRDKDVQRNTRSKAFIKQYPELDIDKPSINELELALRAFIKGTTDNDLSDRRQLAEAILSGFPYFITLDEGILKCQKEIAESYNLKIIKPEALYVEVNATSNASDYFPSKLSGDNFNIKKARAEETGVLVNNFLKHGNAEKKKDFEEKILATWKHMGCIEMVLQGQECVAMVASYEDDKKLIVPLLRTKQYGLRQTIFMQNTYDLINSAIKKNKVFLIIADPHLTDLEQTILERYGFHKTADGYTRGICQQQIFIENLSKQLAEIIEVLPHFQQLIDLCSSDLSVQEQAFNIYLLEKQLWPLKIVDARIPCYIVPIKPTYAKQLFDTKAAKMDLFGIKPTLIWSKENVYYRRNRPPAESYPARILWYASSDKTQNRQMCLVCSSYLDEVEIGPAKDLYKNYEKYGVFSWDMHIKPLAKHIAEAPIKILKFSDSESFSKVVSLNRVKKLLRESGEKDNNFQSPMKISPSTFIKLYSLGKS